MKWITRNRRKSNNMIAVTKCKNEQKQMKERKKQGKSNNFNNNTTVKKIRIT